MTKFGISRKNNLAMFAERDGAVGYDGGRSPAVAGLLPFLIAVIVFSIRLLVFLAASAARMARFRTSSATTAKPAPASPALAASTAAFKANRFV